MQQNRFLQRDGAELVLTAAGEQAVVAAGDTNPSPFAEPARLAAGVATRFDADAPINEETLVEETCIAQLRRLGWEHIAGDRWDPGVTGRESFREVLLHGRFRDALRRINPDAEGQRWLDERRADQAIGALERRSRTDLLAANEGVTDLLRRGALVEGEGEREQRVQFIDFEHPDRNDFLAINQFRADPPGGRAPIIPDLVLFVNGIPLVVIECKSPLRTNPVEEAITQLLRYANLRGVESDEGVEALFSGRTCCRWQHASTRRASGRSAPGTSTSWSGRTPPRYRNRSWRKRRRWRR